MKKILYCLVGFILCLSGCSDIAFSESNSVTPDTSSDEVLSDKYTIGDEIIFGDTKFYIYKIDDNIDEIYLLAQSNIAYTAFSDRERDLIYANDYEGSFAEDYVNRFVDDLEDMGYVIKSSGIPDMEDIYDLGFCDSSTLSGRPYLLDNTPSFICAEDTFWLDGYYKVDTYKWAYTYGQIDTESCYDNEYGVRPAIIVDASEIDKVPYILDSEIKIQDIIDSEYGWESEGGIHNPYDRYYFDCDTMIFLNIFESSVLSETYESEFQIIDEKTIRIHGFKWYSDSVVEIRIVNPDKLRVRFLDDTYSDDCFLNRITVDPQT